MRIGILTFHNAINYGAVLQAYAMQRAILKLGIECEIINYSCAAVERQYRRKKMRECASWKVYINDIMSLHRLDRKKEAFRSFSDSNLVLSQRISRISECNTRGYDAIIVGSDQIFNPKNTDGDGAYLLNFHTNSKKIAYAASVGNNKFFDLWQEKYNIDYKSLMSEFKAISFREREAADFAAQLFGQPYKTVVDPVLLMGNDLWERFCRTQEKEDYIFVYNLGNNSHLVKTVKNIRIKTGLKVYVVNKDIKGDILFYKYNNISSVSPEEFLKMLFGAKYVVTDSFHGTAFSILFHKRFYSVVNPGANNTNSRIRCLLEELNLENRIVSLNCKMDLDKIPNYNEADKRLQIMRTDSFMWLKKALDS